MGLVDGESEVGSSECVSWLEEGLVAGSLLVGVLSLDVEAGSLFVGVLFEAAPSLCVGESDAGWLLAPPEGLP